MGGADGQGMVSVEDPHPPGVTPGGEPSVGDVAADNPVSVFDLFKLGVGPSSSHTMGPMTAAGRFIDRLRAAGRLGSTARVRATLYASLALTGRGHATDRAVILGLAGFAPEAFDPEAADAALAAIRGTGVLRLGGAGQAIAFDEARDLVWRGDVRLPRHPNALRLEALGEDGEAVDGQTYFSLGGGFVCDEEEFGAKASGPEAAAPFPFRSAADLLRQAQAHGLTIADLMLRNELARRSEAEVAERLERIAGAMEACIERGLQQGGILPGGLKVRRRAFALHQALLERAHANTSDPLIAMDWINLWALAVNEENAAGGRVVTAPTNGAAGIIPAVLRYHRCYHAGEREDQRTFLLTAGAIGALYKRNGSISGAEVGCQGEVGVACSMAAAGLAAVLGGSNAQIENAAEIAMEHNLGLTCDPVGGLVQIPCIERNAMGAVKAIDAARLALNGDGEHAISLDRVIATMLRTGQDMSEVYKETALGGLAVNFPEC